MQESTDPAPSGLYDHPPAPLDHPNDADPFDPTSINRPDETLLTYFMLIAALTTVAFPFVFLPLYFKYKTLRYKFDDEGISMRWGFLWRQEINLTYRRIQDIHVTRGIIQRYFGLASLAIQTASGSAGAEMTIIGIKRPEALRDFLYRKMRGLESNSTDLPPRGLHESRSSDGSRSTVDDEALMLLREIRDELRRLHTPDPNAGGPSS